MKIGKLKFIEFSVFFRNFEMGKSDKKFVGKIHRVDQEVDRIAMIESKSGKLISKSLR